MTWTPESIVELFAFGRWADGKLMESASALNAEEFARKIGGSFGSVQATFVHLYGADWVWLERWHGRSPRALPAGDDLGTLDAIRAKWEPVLDGHRAFAASLTPARMPEPLSYVNFAGQNWTYSLGEALFHVANHGTYHRGQLATLLRQLGKTAISTDYLRYRDALAGK